MLLVPSEALLDLSTSEADCDFWLTIFLVVQPSAGKVSATSLVLVGSLVDWLVDDVIVDATEMPLWGDDNNLFVMASHSLSLFKGVPTFMEDVDTVLDVLGSCVLLL